MSHDRIGLRLVWSTQALSRSEKSRTIEYILRPGAESLFLEVQAFVMVVVIPRFLEVPLIKGAKFMQPAPFKLEDITVEGTFITSAQPEETGAFFALGQETVLNKCARAPRVLWHEATGRYHFDETKLLLTPCAPSCVW